MLDLWWGKGETDDLTAVFHGGCSIEWLCRSVPLDVDRRTRNLPIRSSGWRNPFDTWEENRADAHTSVDKGNKQPFDRYHRDEWDWESTMNSSSAEPNEMTRWTMDSHEFHPEDIRLDLRAFAIVTFQLVLNCLEEKRIPSFSPFCLSASPSSCRTIYKEEEEPSISFREFSSFIRLTSSASLVVVSFSKPLDPVLLPDEQVSRLV